MFFRRPPALKRPLPPPPNSPKAGIGSEPLESCAASDKKDGTASADEKGWRFKCPSLRPGNLHFRLLAYPAIFILAAAVLAYINNERSFVDPDCFYHLKMALLIRDRGIITAFPWLPYTTLAEAFADHHFLYHLTLIPFVSWFEPFLGLKIATVVLAAAAMTAFYALLRAYRTPYAFLFTLILTTSGGFIFRLDLAKTTAVSLLFIFLALIAWRRNSRPALFILAWLFVWLYGGWPLLLVLAGAFLAGRLIAEILDARTRPGAPAPAAMLRQLFDRTAAERLTAWPEFRNTLAVAAGLIVGLVANPFFPKNIAFYWQQIVQVAVVNYGSTISVGTEWLPYTLLELFGRVPIVFIVFAIILTVFLVAVFWGGDRRSVQPPDKKQVATLTASLLLAVFFLGLALRSRRHVEYFAPFAVYFEALLLAVVLPYFDPRGLPPGSPAKRRLRLMAVILAVYLAIFLPFIALRDVIVTGGTYRTQGLPWTKYERAATWLKNNTPEGAVIFHSDWDDFPILFFWDDRNRYISGLDNTFFYLHDSGRFQEWTDITTGRRHRDIADIAVRDFDARYFFVENDHEAMRNAVEADPAVHKVYADDEATIYAVTGL